MLIGIAFLDLGSGNLGVLRTSHIALRTHAYVTEPYQHTPVDYEEVLTPVLSPSARNMDEAAKPWDGDIPRRLETGAKWFAPPSRSAGT